MSLTFVLLLVCRRFSKHLMPPRKIREPLARCNFRLQVSLCWPWLWLGLVLSVDVSSLLKRCLEYWAFLDLMLGLGALHSHYWLQVLKTFPHCIWCPFPPCECFLLIEVQSFLWKPWCPWFSWRFSTCVPLEFPSFRCAGLGSQGSSPGPPRRGR